MFQHFRASLVKCNFYVSFKPGVHSTNLFQASLTTLVLWASLVHIASNLKGLGRKSYSILVSIQIGQWFEPWETKWDTPALGYNILHSSLQMHQSQSFFNIYMASYFIWPCTSNSHFKHEVWKIFVWWASHPFAPNLNITSHLNQWS